MTNYKERYGSWAGNKAGHAPDKKRCCAEVHPQGQWYGQQCARPNGHGPNGEYCKQHDPAAVEARRAAADAKYAAQTNALRYQLHGPKFFAVLQKIADGHNDPRALAKETIDEFLKGAR